MLEALARASIQGGLLIAVLYGLVRAFPSIPANAQCWLWRAVFVKLLVSALGLGVIAVPILSPPKAVQQFVVAESVEEPAFDEPVPEEPKSPWPTIWVGVWSFGGAVCIVRLGHSVARASSLKRATTRISVGSLETILSEIAPGRKPDLLGSDRVQSPFLISGRRPAIVLPRSVIDGAAEGDLRLMLAHEVAHLRRRDLFWNWPVALSQVVFYFHPLVWLANRCYYFSREAATDELALKLTGASPRSYGEMLLRSAGKGSKPFAAEPAGVAMVESYRTVHKRLLAMKNIQSKPSLGRIAATALAAAIVIGFIPTFQLTEAVAQTAPPKPALATAPKAHQVKHSKRSRPARATRKRSAKSRKSHRTQPVPALAPVPPSPQAPLPGNQGVPMLKDIPIVGKMFKTAPRPGHPGKNPVPATDPVGVPVLKDIPIVGKMFKTAPRAARPGKDPLQPVMPPTPQAKGDPTELPKPRVSDPVLAPAAGPGPLPPGRAPKGDPQVADPVARRTPDPRVTVPVLAGTDPAATPVPAGPALAGVPALAPQSRVSRVSSPARARSRTRAKSRLRSHRPISPRKRKQ